MSAKPPRSRKREATGGSARQSKRPKRDAFEHVSQDLSVTIKPFLASRSLSVVSSTTLSKRFETPTVDPLQTRYNELQAVETSPSITI